MPNHYTSNTTQSTTNAQGQVAPPGYHYMPDGTLMSDEEHERLHGTEKIISGFNLDYTAIPQTGERREFSITGDDGAVFSLEIKDEDGKYYNFNCEEFGNDGGDCVALCRTTQQRPYPNGKVKINQ